MNVIEFPLKKRKTPDDYQKMHENQYKADFLYSLRIVLVLPGVFVLSGLLCVLWISPGITINLYRILILVISYLIFAVICWFIFIPKKPKSDVGFVVRELVDRFGSKENN